jgi:cytochrome c-type biogenesis protein CcmF
VETIKYIGERIFIGQLGHFFVMLSFVAALLSFGSFYLACKKSDLFVFARIAFKIHAVAVIGIIAVLFIMLFNHYFEYQYVFQHSNREMDMKYILSCFWEGQEGSFLLWTFWNVVLGLILNKQLKQTEWEAPVLMIFSLVQVFLASMLLGIYIGDYKIGSNPFLLLREHQDFYNIPVLQSPDYVSKLSGRGLNPLLMNYWMTIHPPTLFLGFSSTLVPFAFALAALFNRNYQGWQKTALPWTLFSILVLGVGILMGGAWAYEALSFGGFWAWDPVENSSLVPWLVIVAAGHTMIINKNKGGSLFTTHFLAITSFLLVLYSTFLTRSGVLGNASVHSFTDLGMTGQLVLYVLTFIFLSVALLLSDSLIRLTYVVISILLWFAALLYGYKKLILGVWSVSSLGLIVYAYYKYFPKEKEEEELYSREFWMFLGSIVFLLSALIITYFTSVPVINKLFGLDKAPPKPYVYNEWMLPFTVLIMILVAAAQFLKYKKTDAKTFYKRISKAGALSLVFGLACSIPLYVIGKEENNISVYNLIFYILLFTSALFTVFANFDYWFLVLKGKVGKAGASIAHIGFALIVLGALISTSKKTTLSKNTAAQKVSSLGTEFDDQKSILLTQGDTLPMGPYLVTYKGKRKEGINYYFDVDYFKPGASDKPEYDFTLSPSVQDNPRMGRSPEPDTKHYLNRDIYTHVTYGVMEMDTSKAYLNAYSDAKNFIGHAGDTIIASNALVVIDSIKADKTQAEYYKSDSEIVVTAVLKAITSQSKVYYAYPQYIIKNNVVIPKEDVINPLGLKFVFWKINPQEGTVEITLSEKNSNTKEFIVLEAYMFPYINVLWIGCILMAIGTGIAVRERLRLLKAVNHQTH